MITYPLLLHFLYCYVYFSVDEDIQNGVISPNTSVRMIRQQSQRILDQHDKQLQTTSSGSIPGGSGMLGRLSSRMNIFSTDSTIDE